MKGWLYLLSSFAILAIGIVASLKIFDYSLYEEYRFLHEIALYSTEKNWLMEGMVRKQRNILFVNIVKTTFIFLCSFVIMKILLNKALEVSAEERNAEQ